MGEHENLGELSVRLTFPVSHPDMKRSIHVRAAFPDLIQTDYGVLMKVDAGSHAEWDSCVTTGVPECESIQDKVLCV